MIDIDNLDRQLELALTGDLRVHRILRPAEQVSRAQRVDPAGPAATAPPPAATRGPGGEPPVPAGRTKPARSHAPAAPTALSPPSPCGHADPDPGSEAQARRLGELLGLGLLDQCAAEIEAHRRRVTEKGSAYGLRDDAAWSVMTATLHGCQREARSALAKLLAYGHDGRDAAAAERHLAAQLWVVSEWGDDDERFGLLDKCRQRAYCHDELPWRAALTLLLARMGRFGEACREFDATMSRHREAGLALSLDAGTHLAEAAWLLGDPTRGSLLDAAAATWTMPVVVIDRGWICKGASARFRALVAATASDWVGADAGFAAAVATHRNLDAMPLLARTLYEWGCTLAGRDDAQAGGYFDESAAIARRLALTGLPTGRPASATAV